MFAAPNLHSIVTAAAGCAAQSHAYPAFVVRTPSALDGFSFPGPAQAATAWLEDRAYPRGTTLSLRVRRHGTIAARTVETDLDSRGIVWRYRVLTDGWHTVEYTDGVPYPPLTLDDARAELARDHEWDQGVIRRIERTPDPGWGYTQWEDTGECRTVTRRRIKPVTIAGGLRRQLDRWYDECAVSRAILNNETHNTHLDYVALRSGVLSYLPAGRDHIVTEDGTWSRTGRQEAKPGRLARRFLTPEALARLSDYDIERFGARAEGTKHAEAGTITLVRGEDVRRWYHVDSHAATGTGTLASSCMRYAHCQDYLDLYVRNPDVCALAILTNDDGDLIGRALVWTLTDGSVAMDRVYGTDATQQGFIEHATEQGWATPYYGYGSASYMTVQLSQWDVDGYPYLDTFHALNTTDGTLCGHADTNDADRSLRDTGGGYDWVGTTCAGCDRDLPPGSEHDGPNDLSYCEECFADRFVVCAQCSAIVRIENAEEAPNRDDLCHHCYQHQYRRCGACSQTHDRDELRYSDRDDVHYCEGCDPYTACLSCGSERDPAIVECPVCARRVRRANLYASRRINQRPADYFRQPVAAQATTSA